MTGVPEVIVLTSGSEDEEEEEDSYVKVIYDVNGPARSGRSDLRQQCSSDIAGSKWILPELKIPLKTDFAAIPIIDLTDCTDMKEEDFEIPKVCGPTDEQIDTLQRSPANVCMSTQVKQTQSCANPQTPIQTGTHGAPSPYVKITRLPFIEDHIAEIKHSSCFVYSSNGPTTLQPGQQHANSEEKLPRFVLNMECCDDAAETPGHSNSSSQASPAPTHEHAASERQSEDDPIDDESDVGSEEDLQLVCIYQQASEDPCMGAGEERDFVCPVALKKVLSRQDESSLMDISLYSEALGPPEELSAQSLTLVNSTKEEELTEGTLQLLSDLLQPGYYPPDHITYHLLHDILLKSHCSDHQRVQAFHLLIRIQRHRPVDTDTVQWDWDLLTSVMTDKEDPKKYKGEVVCMFLEYVVRTLEDDFHAGSRRSICGTMLSCQYQFPNVRDLLKWLFSAILKSTEGDEGKGTARERDEHTKLVFIFQRMLSLALLVDRNPTVQSDKLSQELLHMTFLHSFQRAHRMLLLGSLRSKLLQCKLLQHLLLDTCAQKSKLPLSLSLLLHFMRNCAPMEDPTDGPERWRSWEELLHLLWMFLHSYNKTMEGCLRQSFAEESSRPGPFKKDDIVSRSDVCGATEAFLKRARDDLGQALPHHVVESLNFLRDILLDRGDFKHHRIEMQ